MRTLSKADQFSVLNDMGIAWYVPNSFDASEFLLEAELTQEVASATTEVVHLARPADILRESISPEAAVVSTPPQEEAKVIEVAAVTPFSWLIARSGFITFICDIKQPKLAPVWHAAAQELLADIAIALGSQSPLSSQYFSWPPIEANVSLGDADLGDFLSEYLGSNDSDPVFVLMGASASEHASPVVLKGAKHVAIAALGQLFRDHQQKKVAWQQLKPLCR